MSVTSNNLKVREIIHQVVNDPAYKQVAHVPLISYPQLALILLAYVAVIGGLALYIYGGVSLWIVYPIMIFGFYTAFTPLHDATHRAVSSNNILNDVLGSISSSLLFPLSNAVGYRYLHLAHHRYVGDKDLDPDETMVSIPTKYFPIGYLLLLFPGLTWAYWLLFKVWKRTPVKTRLNVLSMIVGNILFHTVWLLSPLGSAYFLLFFIPNRLAIAYTSLTFAHAPHPEGLKREEHPFTATFSLTGSKYFLWSMYGQNHHSMHHFLPHIPWHKYFKVWDLANGIFQKQDIPMKGVFSKPDLHYKDKIRNENINKTTDFLVKVVAIREVGEGIKTFVFQPANENITLSEFTAGSHINVFLPSGKVRSYSCVNPPHEQNQYQIAVKLERSGEGGSKEMHEQISVGNTLKISYPKNNFVLYENTQKYILIAGGIGVTPLLSMAHRLTEIDKHFELHICTKSKKEVPFLYELKNWTFAPNVEIHLDEKGKSSMDINKTLACPDDNTLIYVCGPTGFIRWIKETALTTGWNENQIKQEVFSREVAQMTETKSFQLLLKKSGKSIIVKKEETIIDALQLNNIQVPYSCLQGTCGTCMTDVLDGEVDHRDVVLTSEEKAENKKMCICVSRAKNDKLVIDV